MLRGKIRYIILTVIFLSFALLMLPVGASTADSGISSVITCDDAITKAMDYTHKIAEIDQTIKSLWKQEDSLMSTSNAIQAQLDSMNDYTRLYDKWKSGNDLDMYEQYKMSVYRAMFGDVPPNISSTDMFNNFIKNRDFPHYAVWGSIQDLMVQKDAAKMSISAGIRELYDNMLYFSDAIMLQSQLYDTMSRQNAQLHSRYSLGMAAESDVYISDIELQKQKISVSKLKRSYDNLVLQLKLQTGISLTQNISLQDYNLYFKLEQPASYDEYLNNALTKRSEIVTAKMDLQVKQRELDIMKQYLTDALLPDRLDAQQAADDKNIALKEAIQDITDDIYSGYTDLISKYKDVKIYEDKLSSAHKNCNNAMLQYEQGMIPISVLWNLETELTNAEISYNKSIRDYNRALYRMELASGIGPGYNSILGGM